MVNGNPFGAPAGVPAGDDDFDLDLSNPDVTGLIPEGTYTARVASITKSVSKAGNPMFVWDFVIMDAGRAVEPIKLYTALSPANAVWKATEAISALGLGKPGEPVHFKRDDAINRMCQVVIVHAVFNGSQKPDIGRMMPHPDGVGKKWQGGMGGFGAAVPPVSPSTPVDALGGFGENAAANDNPPVMDEGNAYGNVPPVAPYDVDIDELGSEAENPFGRPKD